MATGVVSTLVKVTGLPADLSSEDIEVYFETAKSGGRKGCIKKCVVEQNGVAFIEFDSPEVADCIVSQEGHTMCGHALVVQYASIEQKVKKCKLLVTQLPAKIEMDYLKLLLEKVIGTDEFSLEQQDSTSVMVIFQQMLPGNELKSIITKIESKKMFNRNPKVLNAEKIGMEHLEGTLQKPPTTATKVKPKKFKLLVTTSEPIDTEHLLLLLEKAMDMKSNTDFYINVVGPKDWVVTLERTLSDEEVELLIKQIKTKPLKINIKATVIDGCQLLLSELPSIQMDHLQLLLEKMIGQENKFTLKQLNNSKALLEFKRSMPDEDIDAVVAVLTSTKVKDTNIKVRKLELPYVETSPSISLPCRLLLSGFCSVDIDHLGLLIERTVVPLKYNTDFLLDMHGDSAALMTLKQQLSDTEQNKIIALLTKVEVKGSFLNVEVFNDEISPTTLHISNIPPNCQLGLLGLHLEKPLKMEHESQFTLTPHLLNSSALVTFKKCLTTQELEEAIKRINTTEIKGTHLKAAVFTMASDKSEDASTLILQDIPDNVDEEYLVTFLSIAMNIDEREFSVKSLGNGAAMLSFKKCLTDSALQDKISKIQSKIIRGKFVKVVSWKTTPCICVQDITEHYDEDYLLNYFESGKRSGGGEVVSLELFGNGEAKVMFKELKVMKNVIQRSHDILGKYVTVIQDNPLKKCGSNNSESVVLIQVPPTIMKALCGDERTINVLLSDLHASVSLDKDRSAINISLSKKTPARWTERAKSVVNKYIDNNFAEKDLPVSKEAALEIFNALQQWNKDGILFSFSEESTILHLVGHPKLLVEIQNKVSDILSGFKVINEHITLEPDDYDYILLIKQQEITKTFHDVKITFTDPYTIQLNGVTKTIRKLVEVIPKLSAHFSMPITLDPLLTHFALTKDGHKQISDYFSSCHGISSCIKGVGSKCCVLVLCDPKFKEKIIKAVSPVQEKLHIEKISVASKFYDLLSEPHTNKEHYELCAHLQNKHGVVIETSGNDVLIAGFRDKVAPCHLELYEFIQSKCKMTSTIEIEDGIWQLFQHHMKSEWDAIVTRIAVKIVQRLENKITTLTIHGQADIVHEIHEKLSAMKKTIITQDVYPPTCAIGFHEHTKCSDWKIFVSGTETINKVCISVINLEDGTKSGVPEVQVKGRNSPCSLWTDFKSNADRITPPESVMQGPPNLKCLKIHKGSLLDVKADVYVNSTNAKFELNGGAISQLLAEAAGPTLQEECICKAPIAPGQIVVTGSGKIKSKYIFHLSLSSYDGPGGSAEKDLQELMVKCLNECKQRKISSIAFPALGTGQLKFPPQVAAKIMIESVAAMKDSNDIMVHFVIPLDAVHKAFTEMMQQTSKFNTGRPTYTFPSSMQAASTSDNIFVIDCVTVEIVQGDITDCTADVIVNSSSSDMKSTSGVSGAILNKGGSELVKACEAYIAKNKQLDVGKVAVTKASGGLKCKSVFHVNIQPAQLESAVTKCLNEANNLRYHSIAFPALATGNHKLPADKAASEMLMALHQYALQKPQHTILVSIVVFQSQLLSSFLKILQPFQPPNSTNVDAHIEMSQNDPTTIHSVPTDSAATPSFLLRIFGKNGGSVLTTATVLYDYFNKNFVSETFDTIVSPSAEASKMCSDNCVTLHHDSKLNSITLTGQKCWVDNVRRKFENDNILHEKMMSLKREAELLQKHVEWQHQISDMSFVPYSAGVNFQIEKAFQNKEPIYHHNESLDSFCIDFEKKIETKTKPNSSAVPVRREDLLDRYRNDTPKSWEKMPIDLRTKNEAMYHLFNITNTSKEYIDVHQRFVSTVRAKKIVSIQRVQNIVLYAQYVARKKVMEKLNPPGTKNENMLFHGTDVLACHKINSQGFNRSFSGAHATNYGRGVYFAVDASYSAHPTYSPSDTNGHRYMYLARVLTGEYTIGNQTMIVPPPKDAAKNPNVLFDSLVDKLPTPAMYIVFQDAQAYPEYLITFVDG